jgi:hypothetical protein
MDLGPLTSRVLRRAVVSNWAEGNAEQDADDILNDVLDGRTDSFEIFRSAVALRDPPPYLGRPGRLVWCTPSEDIEARRASGVTTEKLLQDLGLDWAGEDVIEVLYPALVAGTFYKPCAIHAGANPQFQPTHPDSEFGLTNGGLREAVHMPLLVATALDNGARLRLWRML